MSIEAMVWAMAQQSLQPIDKFVLLCMCDMAQDNRSTVADASISRYTNLPECEVPQVIDRLVRLGFVLRNSIGKYILAVPVDAPAARSYRKKVIGSRLRLMVFERDGYACLRCKSQKNLRADHVLPESSGGEAVLENLQTLCMTCNSWKGTKTIDFRDLSRASA
jgi:hypothetical protein